MTKMMCSKKSVDNQEVINNYIFYIYGGARGVMVIVIRRNVDTSSNPGRD